MPDIHRRHARLSVPARDARETAKAQVKPRNLLVNLPLAERA